jgi:uncharacterized DUF497 family protein
MDQSRSRAPQFEFDERRSRINKLKHGMDFVEAQALWLDEALDEYRVERAGEARFLGIGVIGGRHWSAVITYRGDKVRLISVRRARAKEVERYESE